MAGREGGDCHSSPSPFGNQTVPPRPRTDTSKKQNRRCILHFDLDCFYAQVEMIKDPAVRSKPVGVRQKMLVITSNYEARRHGITKGMTVGQALARCPSLVLKNGENLDDYKDFSERVCDLLTDLLASPSFSCPVERLGLDENFADISQIVRQGMQVMKESLEREQKEGEEASVIPPKVSSGLFKTGLTSEFLAACIRRRSIPVLGNVYRGGEASSVGFLCGTGCKCPEWKEDEWLQKEECEVASCVPVMHPLKNKETRGILSNRPAVSLDSPECRLALGTRVALAARRALLTRLQLSTCGGIAHNKTLAKLVGGLRKPNCQSTVFPAQAAEFLGGHQLGKIPGIGMALQKRLQEIGMETVVDIQEASLSSLIQGLGSASAQSVKGLCDGSDSTPVVASGPPKSLSVEDSFWLRPVTGMDELRVAIQKLASHLSVRCLKTLKRHGVQGKTLRLAIRQGRGVKSSPQEGLSSSTEAPWFREGETAGESLHAGRESRQAPVEKPLSSLLLQAEQQSATRRTQAHAQGEAQEAQGEGSSEINGASVEGAGDGEGGMTEAERKAVDSFGAQISGTCMSLFRKIIPEGRPFSLTIVNLGVTGLQPCPSSGGRFKVRQTNQQQQEGRGREGGTLPALFKASLRNATANSASASASASSSSSSSSSSAAPSSSSSSCPSSSSGLMGTKRPPPVKEDQAGRGSGNREVTFVSLEKKRKLESREAGEEEEAENIRRDGNEEMHRQGGHGKERVELDVSAGEDPDTLMSPAKVETITIDLDPPSSPSSLPLPPPPSSSSSSSSSSSGPERGGEPTGKRDERNQSEHQEIEKLTSEPVGLPSSSSSHTTSHAGAVRVANSDGKGTGPQDSTKLGGGPLTVPAGIDPSWFRALPPSLQAEVCGISSATEKGSMRRVLPSVGPSRQTGKDQARGRGSRGIPDPHKGKQHEKQQQMLRAFVSKSSRH